MDTFLPILIVVSGISIGVIGILIAAVFIWLNRSHTPAIPASPPSTPAAFSFASSPQQLSIDPSWDSIGLYSSEGGERDNRTFDRNTLRAAAAHSHGQQFDQTARGSSERPSTLELANGPVQEFELARTSDLGVADAVDAHIYSELNHNQRSGHNETKVEIEAASPATLDRTDAGRISSLTRHHHYVNCENNNNVIKIISPEATKNGAGGGAGGGGQSVSEYFGAYKYVSGGGNHRGAVRATSFQNATPVNLIGDESFSAKDSLQGFNAEGDLSMASLSTIVSEQSDASIVLRPLPLTRPAPSSSMKQSTEEMYI